MQSGTLLWCPLSAWDMQCHTGAMVLQNQQSQPLLLSLSVIQHMELIGNLSNRSSTWEMKHLECTQPTSSIWEEALHEESSDVRRPENRLVPSPRIKHQQEGLNFPWKHYPELVPSSLFAMLWLLPLSMAQSFLLLPLPRRRCCRVVATLLRFHLCEPNSVGSHIPLKPELRWWIYLLGASRLSWAQAALSGGSVRERGLEFKSVIVTGGRNFWSYKSEAGRSRAGILGLCEQTSFPGRLAFNHPLSYSTDQRWTWEEFIKVEEK